MIPAENIKTVISAMTAAIGLTIIRSDQQGKHPAYPFGVYKKISSAGESAYRDIREEKENAGDPTLVDITKYEKSEAIISLGFIDKNRVDRIYGFATQALRYFKSFAGRELAKANLIVVQIISPSIEDRTIYQEAFFENKIGFDIRFDYSGSETETIEAVTTITIENERDGIAQPDIVITP